MADFLSKFKIPTLLGLTIIIFGIVAGVFLTLRGQKFISSASPDVTPENITISNISDNSVTISWQTSSSNVSFLSFGINSPSEQTVLDDRDGGKPKAHLLHYTTIKNLLPKTTYQYRIISGNLKSESSTFTTAAPLFNQNGFRPIIGSVLDGDIPLNEGIVYLAIAGAEIESFLIKESGNFLIPISQIRKFDLSAGFSLSDDTLVKLTIISSKGEAMASFKLKDAYDQLPPIKLGENLDLTTNVAPTTPSSPQDLINYDLNSDGKINAKDNAIILQNFDKKGKNLTGDLNNDGIIDQKDLELMSKQINK